MIIQPYRCCFKASVFVQTQSHPSSYKHFTIDFSATFDGFVHWLTRGQSCISLTKPPGESLHYCSKDTCSFERFALWVVLKSDILKIRPEDMNLMVSGELQSRIVVGKYLTKCSVQRTLAAPIQILISESFKIVVSPIFQFPVCWKDL